MAPQSGDQQKRLVDSTLLVLGARVMAIVGPLVAAWFFNNLVGGLNEMRATIQDTSAKVTYGIVPKLAEHDSRILRLEERHADGGP